MSKGTGVGGRFTPQRKEVYLAELERTGLRGPARLAANISVSAVSVHLKKDPEFAEREQMAFTLHRLGVENEIRRRGMEGVLEPVFQQGGKVGEIRRYSDALLLRYAERHIKEYRKQLKVDQHTTGTLAVGLEDLTKLPREGRDLLRKLLECEIDEDGEEE